MADESNLETKIELLTLQNQLKVSEVEVEIPEKLIINIKQSVSDKHLIIKLLNLESKL